MGQKPQAIMKYSDVNSAVCCFYEMKVNQYCIKNAGLQSILDFLIHNEW